MSSQNYTNKGWYYFCVTEDVQKFFDNNRRYIVRPTEQTTDGKYKARSNRDNSIGRNPHFGAYEGYEHDVPRYGWRDHKGSVWVPSTHGIESEEFHWSIFRTDGTIGVCFPSRPLIVDENVNAHVITLSDIILYSPNDEQVFLEWLVSLDCIRMLSGDGSELRLNMVSNDIFSSDLDELIGLFYRYGMDMKQLRIFLTDENKAWFYDNKDAYWIKRVFGE